MVLGVAVLLLVAALISFCIYHRVILSRVNTHSTMPCAGSELSGTNNVLELTSYMNNDSIKLNVNQAYGGVQSSAAAPQHIQDVEYECVRDVLVGNASQSQGGGTTSP